MISSRPLHHSYNRLPFYYDDRECELRIDGYRIVPVILKTSRVVLNHSPQSRNLGKYTFVCGRGANQNMRGCNNVDKSFFVNADSLENIDSPSNFANDKVDMQPFDFPVQTSP
jgi:hypothetical protein